MLLAQWYVPGKMIADMERVARSGEPFRFQIAPIDPNDPFRGRYVTLSFLADEVEQEVGTEEWLRGNKAYASLRVDSSGYAQIAALTLEPPTGTPHYIEVAIRNVYDNRIAINYPFDRFYMEESKAPVAETAYRDAIREDQEAYALVRVDRGIAWIEDVILDGKSIGEL